MASFQWRDNDDKYLLTAEYIRSYSEYSFWQNWLRDNGGISVAARNTRPFAGTELQFDEDGVFQSGFLTHANSAWRGAGLIGPGQTEPNTRIVNPYGGRPAWTGDIGSAPQFGHPFTTQTERLESHRKLEDTSLNFV